MHYKITPIPLILIVIAIILILIMLFINSMRKMDLKQVCVNNKCFEVEIAKTDTERVEGLMFRENLAQNAGMLFVFNKEDFYSFWMKNTKISLDIIWIGADNKIVHIEKNALPCETENCQSYKSTQKAKYVLEINAGLAEQFGIKAGDLVSLPKNF